MYMYYMYALLRCVVLMLTEMGYGFGRIASHLLGRSVTR
jgi:hypothetical protein